MGFNDSEFSSRTSHPIEKGIIPHQRVAKCSNAPRLHHLRALISCNALMFAQRLPNIKTPASSSPISASTPSSLAIAFSRSSISRMVTWSLFSSVHPSFLLMPNFLTVWNFPSFPSAHSKPCQTCSSVMKPHSAGSKQSRSSRLRDSQASGLVAEGVKKTGPRKSREIFRWRRLGT